MIWKVGQRVQCDGLDWGPCQITFSSEQLVIIYCPRYELAMTAPQAQLEQAGWKLTQPTKVVWVEDWSKHNHSA